jgi:hypothetical protein
LVPLIQVYVRAKSGCRRSSAERGIGYQRYENASLQVVDVKEAKHLCDRLRLASGSSASDLLASVLRSEIDWSALPPDTPSIDGKSYGFIGSSFRIVPTPCPSRTLALVGLVRFTKNVSAASN